tara:strand:- start:198 stop:431 length:234 start_codon:yes stop_codon:yes gene_type:complete
MWVSNYTHANPVLSLKYFNNTSKSFLVKQTNGQMKESKKIEKEKVIAERLNGRFAMMGFIALVGAYLTTGQIIPGFV